jgi:hypothetical protein
MANTTFTGPVATDRTLEHADTDGFVDGITAAVNSTGLGEGFLPYVTVLLECQVIATDCCILQLLMKEVLSGRAN